MSDPSHHKSLSERYAKMLACRPDEFTYRWLQESMGLLKESDEGHNVSLNIAHARIAALTEKVASQDAVIDSLKSDCLLQQATIGELQSKVIPALERIERMAEWINSQVDRSKPKK